MSAPTDLPAGYSARPAGADDQPAVQAVVFAALAEFGLAADPAGTDADLTDLEGFYAAAGGCFEVVLDPHARVVGCWGLHPRGPDVLELRKMYLGPDQRGRGLGKIMLSRALSAAESLGARRIELETARVLSRAVALYTAFGFRLVAGCGEAARCDLAMALELAPGDGAK